MKKYLLPQSMSDGLYFTLRKEVHEWLYEQNISYSLDWHNEKNSTMLVADMTENEFLLLVLRFS